MTCEPATSDALSLFSYNCYNIRSSLYSFILTFAKYSNPKTNPIPKSLTQTRGGPQKGQILSDPKLGGGGYRPQTKTGPGECEKIYSSVRDDRETGRDSRRRLLTSDWPPPPPPRPTPNLTPTINTVSGQTETGMSA